MHNENSPRVIVDHLEREFAGLIKNLKGLAASVSPALLYHRAPPVTIGENLLRGAATLEQTFGGLTANLWDDPFEWTLPETMSTAERIVEYLSEVDAVRRRAFSAIASDEELAKYVSVPSGEPQQLFALLIETLVKASDYRGRAVATIKILSGENAAGFII